MFSKAFQRKYALSDQGVKNAKLGTLWTVIVNLVVMGGMGILYLLMSRYMDTLVSGAPLPGGLVFIVLTLAFVALSFLTHRQQYGVTYGLVYGEVKNMRIGIAERLRRLPLGWFGKRDLADLTETIMGDVNRLEHVWSHCLGYLYGSYISTAIVAVMLFAYNWRLALACLWGVPVAFALLFGSRKLAKRHSEITKTAGIQVADGIQETLENMREIRATNQEERFIQVLYVRHDGEVLQSQWHDPAVHPRQGGRGRLHRFSEDHHVLRRRRGIRRDRAGLREVLSALRREGLHYQDRGGYASCLACFHLSERRQGWGAGDYRRYQELLFREIGFMIAKIIIEGILLGTLLVLFCAVGIRNGAVNMVFLYHRDVQDRCVQNGLITREKIRQNMRLFKGLGIPV